jgi:Uma2 family endonuclease
MKPAIQEPSNPLLRPGERLTQPEFHRRYEAYPEDVKFELIGAVVHMPSPVRLPHGRNDLLVSFVLTSYMFATPGTQVLANATTILGAAAEPQPDLCLRILAEFGGRTHEDAEQYLHEGPELVVQVSHSTLTLDLGTRRADCQQAGVAEYLVVDIAHQRLHWFDFRTDRMINPSQGGIARSRVFPGLWIDPLALFAGDGPRITEVIQQGIASAAHARFVQRLHRAHGRLGGP